MWLVRTLLIGGASRVPEKHARTTCLASRSAAVHHAVRMLRLPELEQNHEAAWIEWEESGDEAAWSVTVADGIADGAVSSGSPISTPDAETRPTIGVRP